MRYANVVREIKWRLVVLAGASLMAAVGRNRFHFLAQETPPPGGGLLRRLAHPIARSFSRNMAIVDAVDDYRLYTSDRERIGRTTASERIYVGENLAGWAADTLHTGDQHLPLERQMRGLTIEPVERLLRSGMTAVEIGTGNGAVIAHLAERHPDCRFIGVDFNVTAARRLHHLPNLEYRAGYALDMLRNGDLAGNLMFAASTFIYVGPAELREYAGALHDFEHIVLADPINRGFHPFRFGESVHLHAGLWGHDYRRYFPRGETSFAEIQGHRGAVRKGVRTRFQIFIGSGNAGVALETEALRRSA